MPLELEGVVYLAASQVASEAGISRQTLWRWRRDGKIPSGHRFRDRQILFTEEEVEQIRQYANKVEPLANTDADQMRLF